MDILEDSPKRRTVRKDVDKRFTKDPEIAKQVVRLSSLALSKSAVAIACRIAVHQLESAYADDFRKGQARMQKKIAGAAMKQVEKGNPAMIMFMAKSRLGWTETNVVEHVGEIKAIVSNRPMTREEFANKYLEAEVVEAEVVEEQKAIEQADSVSVRDPASETPREVDVSEVRGVQRDRNLCDEQGETEVSD